VLPTFPRGPDSISSLDSRGRFTDADSLGVRDPLLGADPRWLARGDPLLGQAAQWEVPATGAAAGAPAAAADPPFVPAGAPAPHARRDVSDADSNPAKRQRTGLGAAVRRGGGGTHGEDLEDVVPPSLLTAVDPFDAARGNTVLQDDLQWLDSALASLGPGFPPRV